MFKISTTALNGTDLKEQLLNKKSGALVIFEGWVRNHSEGQEVSSLEYEAYDLLAETEAVKIFKEAREKFEFSDILCVHRKGHLQIGDVAVWLGVTSPHREEAFKACKYVIDEIKHRLPIWKKEHYLNKDAEWVNCQGCYHHTDDEFKVTECEYYSQQTKLAEIGPSGQEKLKRSQVLVVGAGGLGCSALQYLAAAGVGNLSICDFDVVSASNLNRQILYTPYDVGKPKTIVAYNRLTQLNPYINILRLETKVTAENVLSPIENYDLVLDCTDNFKTKFLIHDACYLKNTPLVQASVYQYEGQIQSYLFDKNEACLRCQWPNQPSPECTGNCSDVGVLGVVPGLLGVYQATEALKIILGLHTNPGQKIELLNILNSEHILISRSKQKNCPLCGENPQITEIIPQFYEVSENFDWEITVPLDQETSMTCIDLRKTTDELQTYLDLPREKNYLIICQKGIRSKKLVQALREHGSHNFYSLKNGVEAQL